MHRICSRKTFSEDLGERYMDVAIILKHILDKHVMRVWTELT
jgi:hypothetical protein